MMTDKIESNHNCNNNFFIADNENFEVTFAMTYHISKVIYYSLATYREVLSIFVHLEYFR